jgi:hypothetical protein
LFDLAHAAEQMGDIAEAERLYRLLMRSDPTDASAPFNLGNMLRAAARTVEAEAALRAATRANAAFAEAWYNLADLLDDQGRSEAAIECGGGIWRVIVDPNGRRVRGDRRSFVKSKLIHAPVARTSQQVIPTKQPKKVKVKSILFLCTGVPVVSTTSHGSLNQHFHFGCPIRSLGKLARRRGTESLVPASSIRYQPCAGQMQDT